MSYIGKLLGKDEVILLETKRHIFVLLGQFFKELLILGALVAGWIVIHGYASPEFFWIEIVLAAIAAVVLISLFIDWLRWNNEAFFVTNRRVVHASGVLNKKVLDSSLSKINDVVMEQSFLGRIFDYGTIKILTATEEVINRVDKISRPMDFKKAMMGAKAGLEPLHPAVASTSSSQLLEELAQLKAKNLISEEEYNEKRKEIIKRM